jgi:hypothetical protein
MIRIDFAGCQCLGAFSAVVDYDGKIVAKRPIDGDNQPWNDVRDEDNYVKGYRNGDSLKEEPIIGYRLVTKRNDKSSYDKRPIKYFDLDYMDEELARILGVKILP